jgi:nucleotidyltransferase/DNA polymerase involved in DNA repair
VFIPGHFNEYARESSAVFSIVRDITPTVEMLSLDEAFRVFEAIEDARLALRERGAAPGLQDELATVIRMLHGKLGFDEGGVQ